MQSLEVQTTVVVGNHALTPLEEAAGVAPRPPFLDEAGNPVDPAAVRIFLLAPTGQQRAFSWPDLQTGDAGLVQKEAVGRFYVPWTPAPEEDGLWRWFLQAAMALGTQQSDQDVFYVQRPVVLAAA